MISDFIQDCQEVMRENGLILPADYIGDGKIHRCATTQKPTGRDGAYLLHLDENPNIWWQNHQTGESGTFASKSESSMTPAQRKAFAQRVEREQLCRLREQDAQHAEAAAKAAEIWKNAIFCDDKNPYLLKKGVLAFGLKEDKGGRLIVPIFNKKGEIQSLQYINNRGTKLYFENGKKQGGYFHIPEKNGNKNGPLCITEGYSTAASVHMATDYACLVAFDAGNLLAVATMAREKSPERTIVLCADNDVKPDGPNTGIAKATAAAKAVGGLVAIPESTNGKPIDFNDLHQCQNVDAVRACISAVLATAEKAVIVENRPIYNDVEPTTEAQKDVATYEREIFPPEIPLSASYFVDTTAKGKPLGTIENVAGLMRSYGVDVALNSMSRTLCFKMPWIDASLLSSENHCLNQIVSLAARNNMPTSNVPAFVSTLAETNSFHPVRNWICSKPWDGEARIQALMNTIESPMDKHQKNMLVFRWLVSCVAALEEPRGVSAHGVLVFVGGQGVGKTSWLRNLVPQEFESFGEGLQVDPSDKDSLSRALSYWIVELGELDGNFRKTDIARLKAFITSTSDKIRMPYDRKPSTIQRRTVFAGSVNESQFLVDSTGNRRWWAIPATKLDFSHGLDLQQLWAEVLHHYKDGQPWHLTPEEMEALNASNTEHEQICPVSEKILAAFDWESSTGGQYMSATEVLSAVGITNPTKAQANLASSVLRKLTGGEPTYKKRRMTFFVPEAFSTFSKSF